MEQCDIISASKAESSRSTPFQSIDFLPSLRKGVIIVGKTPSGNCFTVALDMLEEERYLLANTTKGLVLQV